MILAAFAFLGGVLALLMLPAMPHVAAIVAVAVAALAGAIWHRFAAGRALAWACCGFLFAAAHAHHYLRWVWPQHLADERVLGEVVVDSLPASRGEGWLFDATVRVHKPRPLAHDLRVRLISRDDAVRPHAGERWQLLMTMRPPRAALNPGSVDFERLLFHDRIHAMGTVVSSRLNERLDTGHRPLAALRERIARHIAERVTDRDAAALIAALAVGATGEMSREQWRVFNATGTTHLVAISGLHVTLFALVMFAMARQLWSFVLSRWVPWRRENFAAVVGLAAATGYSVLAGLSIPTQRTLLMLAAWLLARSMARAAPPLQPLAIALLAVLLLDPFAPLTAGFWLSFGAMSAILFVVETRAVRRRAMHEAVAVQLAVTAVLAPLTFAIFGSVSLLGPLVNAIAIPYISWLLVPVILLALALMGLWPWASDQALALAEGLHNFAWPWLAAAADSPLALAHASPPAWWYVIAAIALVLVLMPWPLRLRLAAVVCVAPLAIAGRSSMPQGAAELTALDAGNGTAIVVETASHVLVYGTGESYGTEGNRVESVLLPFLRKQGRRAVDRLVISKLTAVTGSGLTALLAAMPVRQTLIGGEAAMDFAGARPCTAGEQWIWDGVHFGMQEHCELQLEMPRGTARISASGAQLIDISGVRWAIVPGRSERNGKEKPAHSSLRRSGVRVCATGDLGAVHISFDPDGSASAPRVLRTERRAVWRNDPPPCPSPARGEGTCCMPHRDSYPEV